MPITSYNIAPYFDDNNVKDATGKTVGDKNYLRILFQPGFALQTREMNQMQSILQTQIDRLGSSFYRDGEAVLDGESSYRDNIPYAEISIPRGVTTAIATADILLQPTIEIRTGSISGGQYAKVLGVDVVNNEKLRVYLQSISDISDSPGRSLNALLPAGATFHYKNDIQITSATGSTTNSNSFGTIQKTGYAFSISVQEGIYYVKGSFVHTPSMGRFWLKSSSSQIVRGDAILAITEKIVTSAQDETLLDNSSGAYNYSAPGADRYQISLDIAFFEKISSDGQYPINGVSGQNPNIAQINSTQTYSIARLFSIDEQTVEVIENREKSNLEKRLARRTFEESGNYTVKPFKVAFREFAARTNPALVGLGGSEFDQDVDPLYTQEQLLSEVPFGVSDDVEAKTKFIVQVEPSTAYVNGFRYEFPEKTTLAVDKAQSVALESGVEIISNQGNFIDVETRDVAVYNTPGGSLTQMQYGKGGVQPNNPASFLGESFNINADFVNAQNSPGPLGLALTGTVNGTNASIIKQVQFLRSGTSSANSPTATYRYYLNERSTLADVKKAIPDFIGHTIDSDSRFGTTSSNFKNVLGTNDALNAIGLKNPQDNAMLFQLPADSVQRVNKVKYHKYELTSGTIGSGQETTDANLKQRAIIPITTTNKFTGISQTDKFDYLVIRRVTDRTGVHRDRIVNPENYQIESGATTSAVTIGAVPGDASPRFFNSPEAGDKYFVYAPVEVEVGPGNIRQKTLVGTTQTGTATGNWSDVLSQNYDAGTIFTLKDCDVDVTSIDGAGGNLAGSFEVIDSGLEDPEFYRRPKIRLLNGVNFTGVNSITYNYYEHGNQGDFFAVNSYANYEESDPTIEYSLLPQFNQESIANFLDFRVKEDFSDPRGASGTEGPAMLVPNRPITFDYKYYLSRKDRIIVTGDGEIQVVSGEPAALPVLPDAPANSMTLYTYFVPAFTISAKSITANYVDNQRSTMKDIGRLRKRIGKVEYTSALNVLENDAIQKRILNSDGSDRFKNGILVDNFRRDNAANPRDINYLAATDRSKGILRPYYVSNNFRLFTQFAPAASENNTSSATDWMTNPARILEINDYYNDTPANTIKFDKLTNELIVTTGRPQILSVSGFKNGSILDDITNGPYVLYKPNNQGYPEYRSIDTNVSLDFAARRIIRDPFRKRWEIQSLRSDKTGYQEPGIFYTYEPGSSVGDDAPFPTSVTTGFKNSANEVQTDALIQDIQNDFVSEPVPDSTTASSRDRYLHDGGNNGSMLSLWRGNQPSIGVGKEILFEQPNCSTTTSVQPYEVTNYVGKVKLSPSGDEWVDTTRKPAQVIQDNTAFEVIEFFQNHTDLLDDHIGVFWNHWQTQSQGVETLSDVTSGNTQTIVTETTTEQSRTGTEVTLEASEAIEESRGDKVVDINMVPFIRSRDISIHATGLKPNTQVYIYFDGKDVSRYVAATDGFKEFGFNEIVAEFNGEGAPSSLVAGGAIQSTSSTGLNHYTVPLFTTPETGEFFGTFRIPNNDEMRFRTGLRTFKITSSKINRDDDADCVAETTYAAYGVGSEVEETIISTRVPEIVRTQVSDERTLVTQQTTETNLGGDPIAQTFTIPKTYPNGVCLTDVDVFFAEKPAFPANVEVYIVPTDQGLPSNVVVPGSRVSLPPAAVTVPPSGRDETNGANIQPTNFEFDYPVYLKSGVEYAMIVFSPTPDYRVWLSQLGGANIKNASRPITSNPSVGVLCKSQNRSTWTADQTKDLMFTMRKGVFDLSRSFVFHTKASAKYGNDQQNIGIDAASSTSLNRNVVISAFNVSSDVLKIPSTNVSFSMDFETDIGKLTNSVYGVPAVIKNKYTYELKKEIDTVSLKVDNIKLTATLTGKDRGDGYSDITPMIDIDKHSLLTFENIIEQKPTTQSEYNDIKGYITKNVKLTNPASRVNIFLTTNRLSEGGNIEVFGKGRGVEQNQGWDELDWERLKVSSTDGNIVGTHTNNSPSLIINSVQEDFSESEYFYSPSIGNIKEYAVKIAFTGDSQDSAKIVRVKDFRAIATS